MNCGWFTPIVFPGDSNKECLIMKMKIYSQWMEDVYIPVRVGQLTKAAKLLGKKSFVSYADATVGLSAQTGKECERQAVAAWLDSRAEQKTAKQVNIA
ncbi:MAG: hypothetical protein II145_01465 [Selenomonas sp.]|nr:hypothetical protein [Selenomonas sp.]